MAEEAGRQTLLVVAKHHCRWSAYELDQHGHEIQISYLYRMQWKSEIDRTNFGDLPTDARLRVTRASFSSYALGSLIEYIDRVFTKNFAYGVSEPGNKRQDLYGGSRLEGKRGMLVTTVGGKESNYSARGIHGPIDDVLFPINHGMLHFTGFEVLPPVVAYNADQLDEAGFDRLATVVRERMRSLDSTAPIPFWTRKSGDYLIPELTLRDGLEREGAIGFALHRE
ncbi:hypothetical protein BU23DRAFT_627440 [Bimuria novae-zelandiae CBS 107.79]|uniref:Flavodoxin-like fold domain-containing protein n=1 Tax=Bimuria novae-zelandiae CBS 107.79 TaxID=1447943 RepID=A0A6A5UNG3_9PLEO|nr:hypothetical protein BU23DRAFT_627440 [Bimuria novae-zelandiae CBS 107.79]